MNNNKGITLIALVITIIVLIILAGVAISMLSGDNGILNQAARAKQENEEQSTLEQIKLAVTASMINTGHKIDTGTLKDELNKIDGINLTENPQLPLSLELDGTRYGIAEDGETYIETWYYTEDKKITNGEVTIELGDEINYNPAVDENGNEVITEYISLSSKNGNSNQKYVATAFNQYAGDETFAWRVLGLERGQILIMPTKNATTESNSNGYFYLGTTSSTDFTNSQNAYVNAEDELDKISDVYGEGKGADGARSVKVEDVNKMTSYNPEDDIIDDGKVYEYGNEVIYSCEEEGKTKYSWGKNGMLQTNTYNSSFTYYTGNEWKTLGIGESTKLKSTYYYYDGLDYQSNCINTNIYNLLFEETNNQYYWLGSFYVEASSGYAFFGVFYLRDSGVGNYFAFDSRSHAGSKCNGVRPVVYLKSDINLIAKEKNSWEIL